MRVGEPSTRSCMRAWRRTKPFTCAPS